MSIVIQSTAIFHTLLNDGIINLCMFIDIGNTIVVGEIHRMRTTSHKVFDIIPPWRSNSIVSVVCPNAHASQSFRDGHDTRKRRSFLVLIFIHDGICGTITTIIGTQITTGPCSFFAFGMRTLKSNSIMNIEMRCEFHLVSECHSDVLESRQEFHSIGIVRNGPDLVFDDALLLLPTPDKLHLDDLIVLESFLEHLSVRPTDQCRRNGNIRSRSIIGQDRFFRLAGLRFDFLHAIRIRTHAPIVGNNDGRCTQMLCISNFGDKCTGSTIDHEKKGRWPFFHGAIRIDITLWISLGTIIHVGITKIRIGVKDLQCNRSTMRWNTKIGGTMRISLWLVKFMRNMNH
mmetsp:Transcript_10136/g.23451  ORF Transcript_10136/g.23451 Transcript_10136/m.23451 type:complete len:344 (+) Transcript_10136:872-1903(+)